MLDKLSTQLISFYKRINTKENKKDDDKVLFYESRKTLNI